MYEKNLTEDLRLRLSTTDMDFLRKISAERSCSISESIRSIIGDYRRSLDTLSVLADAIKLAKDKQKEEEQISNNPKKVSKKKN